MHRYIVIVHTYNMCYLYHMCIKFKEKLNLHKVSERFGLFTFADMIMPHRYFAKR